jgi:protein-disulfide isomerase
VAAVVAVFFAGVGFQAVRSGSNRGTLVRPAHAVSAEGAELLGSPNAPVVVEEYGDFQCPACANWDRLVFPTVERLVNEGRIRFAYHSFAFLGPESVSAASAAVCAGDEGSFWPYRGFLYANQFPENSGALTEDRLIQMGQTVGLSSEAFASCVRGETYRGWIAQVSDHAVDRGVTSTPTIFVNGRALPTPPSPEELIAAVDAAAS